MIEFLKNIFYRILGMFLFFFIIGVITSIVDFFDSTESKSIKTKKEIVKEVVKSDRIISNYINWKDYRNYYYSTNLKISYNDYLKSTKNRILNK